nr:alpha/beta hydrolase [Sphingomicrobium nitratireducens]
MRLLILAFASLFVSQPALAAPDRTDTVAVEDRALDLLVWDAQGETPAGIILFGHGHGADPARYEALLEHWAGQGYTVYAPVNVDSRVHPQRDAFTMQTGFIARVTDLQAARAMIAERHPGVPVVLAGHSFGSFLSLLGGGGKTKAMPALDGPPVAGVLAFSTAGRLPPLLDADAYAGLDGPLLLVTGTQDVVPGFVADWRDHRMAFDGSPAGDKTLLVVEGGAHDLVRMTGEAAPTVKTWADLFLAATLKKDVQAASLYGILGSGARVKVERR